MTHAAATALASELRLAGSTLGVFVSVGITSWQDGALRFFFSGPGGARHSLDVASSSEARVRAHFAGFTSLIRSLLGTGTGAETVRHTYR